MRSRFLVRSGVLLLLAPAAAVAQGVTIDHKEIGCIVAGKYPKMNACFAPASLVKKARVYFRPETLSTWYYVEMSSDAPCFSGVLLKPSKALIDKTIFYYLDVQGGGTGRTPEYAPVVVASEEDCKKKLPVAPLSATGPAAVFPSLPTAGFVTGAGVSTAVVAGGVAAAVAVAGGAKLLTNDDSTAATTPPTVPATNPTTTAPPATVPATTAPPPPPSALVVACQATPRNGDVPLRVDFATFPAGGTGVYAFEWTFGDGAGSTNPNPSHTFLTTGVFNSTVQVFSGDQTVACSRPITVTAPPTPGPPPSAPPKTFKLRVSLAGSGLGKVTGPGIDCPGDCDEIYATGTVVNLTAIASPPSVFKQWTGDCTGPGPCVLTMTVDKNVVAEFELVPPPSTTLPSSPTPAPSGSPAPFPISSLAWSTQLEVPDGEGQVVTNGRIAYAVRQGLAGQATEGLTGLNRVEAVLVRGAGRSGTWRFDFSGQAAFNSVKLRVVAGTVALITDNTVVFRLQGKPGERVVFTFEVDD